MCSKINERRFGLHPSTKNKPSCKAVWVSENWDVGHSKACVCAHRLHIKKEGHATQAKLSD